MSKSGIYRNPAFGNGAIAKWRLSVRFLPIIGYCLLLLAACASSPKPEGIDFMSESSSYSEQEINRADVFVSPRAKQKIFHKVAVMPFRAPVELVGASIADMATTEILRTYKYRLIERSQMQQVLQEQALGLKGVTDSALAMKVGKIIGVEGVIVGTVPEYGMRAVGSLELPAVGINIRLIDSETGAVIWTITDSAISKKVVSLSSFTRRMVKSMIRRLVREWVRAGDTYAVNLPPPQVVSYQGKIRSAVIKVHAESSKKFKRYDLYRSRTKIGPFEKIATRSNSGAKIIIFEDKNLPDAETYYYKIGAVNADGLHAAAEKPLQITTAGPPEPITDLRAQSGQIRMVALSWTPSRSQTVSGYALYRSVAKHGPFHKIRELKNRKADRYIDKGKGASSRRNFGKLADHKTYYYKIRAINVVGVASPDSPVVSAVTRGAPPVVTGFMAQSGLARRAALSWTPARAKEVKGYTIYRGTGESGPFTKVVFLKGRKKAKYIDLGNKGRLKDNTEYFYKIQSVNIVDVHSPDSSVVSATTKPVPQRVVGLNCSQKQVKRVELRWQSSPEGDIKRFELFRGPSEQQVRDRIAKLPANQIKYSDKRLRDGRTYCYKLRAVDKDNLKGAFSDVVCAKTKPPPQKPRGLTTKFENRQIILKWQPNPENDIEYYRVFKHSFVSWTLLGKTADVMYRYNGKIKPGKLYRFRLIAIDKDHLSSKPSGEVSIKVPK